MMEPIFLKLIDSSPVFALLAIVLYISFKMQTERDRQASEEREKFWATLQKVNDLCHELSVSILTEVKNQSENFRKHIEIVTQSHNYQRIEHEQMTDLLKKLNEK